MIARKARRAWTFTVWGFVAAMLTFAVYVKAVQLLG